MMDATKAGLLITAAGLAISLLGNIKSITKWAYRKIRNREIYEKFVVDMATNHLPHIYDALTKLCQKQGIELGEPPQIQFISFEGKNDGTD